MNDPLAAGPVSLSANELHVGVEQMLQHLQRLGVSHLPRANSEAATGWMSLFEDATSNPQAGRTDATSPTVQPAITKASSSATVVTPTPIPTPAPTTSTPHVAGASVQGYQSPALPIAQRQAELDAWRDRVSQCTLCHELACTRKQTVFGEGSSQAKVCFFGEAPGADEDRQGVPFVGRAGQLLTKIIAASKLDRDEVYILNTLKCRPPGNRNPLPDEVKNCRPYFEAQLEIIQPQYIVCLGLIAAQSLLEGAQSIGRMRGRFHTYRGSKVIVTYHPAYLLRNEKMKGATWQDMQMLMRDMGLL